MPYMSYSARSGTWSASASAAGYPASHLATPRVGRPWQSVTLANTTVQIDFGSNQTFVPAIVIMGHNMLSSGLQVQSSTNGSTWTNLGSMLLRQGISGLRKGLYRHGSSITFRYLRITCVGGVEPGHANYRIGYAMVFAAHTTLTAPLYGANARLVFPQWSTALPNGLEVRADAGEPYTEIRLPWRQAGNEYGIERVAERARLEPVLINLELPDRDGWWWVVRNNQPQLERSIAGHNRENTQLVLSEVV